MKILKRAFLISLLIVIFFVILGETFLPSDIDNDNYVCKELDCDWYVVEEDGTRVPIKPGEKYNAERNTEVIFETILTEEPEDGMYLCFRSARQDMKIYVGDELRQEYSNEDIRLFGSTSSPAYVFALLKPGDEGKTIKVVTKSDSSYNGNLSTVYYGERMGIWRYFFSIYGSEIIVGIVLFLLGAFTAAISVIFGMYNKKQFELLYLGLGIAISAMWLMANSTIRDFFVPNVSVVSNTAFMCVALIPLPFMLYMNYEQGERYKKRYFVLGIITVADFIISTVLHVLNIVDYADNIIVIAAVCIADISMIIINIIIDIRKGYVKEYKMVAIGMATVCFAAVLQLLLYFMRRSVMKGVIMGVGLATLMVLAIIKTIRDYLDIERQKQEAVSANKSKSMFLANISHEIRTPINAILGMDEIIIRDCKDKEMLEYARDIQSAGRSLLSLINDILDFSKIESGKMEIVPVEYEVSSLINDSYNMIFMRAKDKKLELKVRNYPNMPRRLFGDEMRIRQVIMNMLTNAVKYTDEGSVTLSVGCERLQDGKVILKISVRDTGIGIKPEDQEKLFESFKRVDEVRNRNVEGTGLGLAITKLLVHLMGGEISVRSEYGKGSIFYVDIPQDIVSDEPMGEFRLNNYIYENEDVKEQKIVWTGSYNVLIVDDVAMNLKVIVGLLKGSGINIDTAESGEECLEATLNKKYDLIFLDHMMPNMSGVETFHNMQKMENNLNKDTPVIMLTANAVQGAKEEYMTEGFSDYLSKPVQRKKLEEMIQKYLPVK